MKTNFKKFFVTYLITFIVSLIIGVVIFLVYYFLNNATLYSAINGFSLSAVIMLSIGGLMWVANEGFFDVFSYGAKQLVSFMFSKKANENNDFPNYREQNRTKRESKPKMFLPIILSGFILFVLMAILRVAEAIQ